jgi:hypothetical protein
MDITFNLLTGMFLYPIFLYDKPSIYVYLGLLGFDQRTLLRVQLAKRIGISSRRPGISEIDAHSPEKASA